MSDLFTTLFWKLVIAMAFNLIDARHRLELYSYLMNDHCKLRFIVSVVK